MKNFLRIVKLCLVLLLTLSVVMIARSALDNREGAQVYAEAAKVARPEGSGAASGQKASAPEAPSLPEEAASLMALDLSALREINPDVVGWIEIPGTGLSYPLMQGEDNQYYLNHTWNRESNSLGAIFLSCTDDPALTNFHTIVYGHRMRSGAMFGMLKYYKNQDYWEAHPSVYLVTDDGVYQYDIFSAREAGVKGLVYRQDLEESGIETELLQDCLDHSVIDSGITPAAEDRILTLSTCTGVGYSARWVVHAVLSASYERASG